MGHEPNTSDIARSDQIKVAYTKKITRETAERLCDPMDMSSRPFVVYHAIESALKNWPKGNYRVSFPEELLVGKKARNYMNAARSNTHIIEVHRNTNGVLSAIAVACIHRGDSRVHIHFLKGYENIANALADSVNAAATKTSLLGFVPFIRPKVILTDKLPSASMSVEEAKRFYPGALTDTRRKLTRLWHSVKNFKGGG